MTKEETKQAILVMQAYVDGKTIECYLDGAEWTGAQNPMWDWSITKYRIKPEPHYRPFKNAEEVLEATKEHGEWLKYIDSRALYRISIIYANANCFMGANVFSSKQMLDDFTFPDGTPFGVKEE